MAYSNVTPLQLIDKFQLAVLEHWGYIWGKAGSVWTQAQQNAATDAMIKKYGQKWVGHKVADCSGLFSWAFKQLGSYMYHGSNTMWDKYCISKGNLKNGKRTDGQELKPATAVFTDHDGDKTHVGLYIGDGKVIEASGTQSGVITSKITNSKWKCWGELKYVLYEGGTEVSEVIGYPTIRQGAKGDLVIQLQTFLSNLGSSLVVDGIFGNGTASAVRAFQKKYGLEVDGIVGPKTWSKLLEMAGNIHTETPAKEPEKQYTLEEKVDILWKAYTGGKANG